MNMGMMKIFTILLTFSINYFYENVYIRKSCFFFISYFVINKLKSSNPLLTATIYFLLMFLNEKNEKRT